jgi:hypothetical protein
VTAEPTVRPDGCLMPAWRWDGKAGVLRPVCPTCDQRLLLSGSRLTCLIVGHSHYHEPTERVVAAALERLAGAVSTADTTIGPDRSGRRLTDSGSLD